jgi:hypothetical protein
MRERERGERERGERCVRERERMIPSNLSFSSSSHPLQIAIDKKIIYTS